MGSDDLTVPEWLVVCGRAERTCALRFRNLAMGAPSPALRDLLNRLAEEEEDHARTLEEYSDRVEWPRVWRLDENRVQRMIGASFPSLGAESGALDAARFAESVEAESARFYRGLSERTTDPQTREFFRSMAEREESHLHRVEALDS